jgi:hypothetical protein
MNPVLTREPSRWQSSAMLPGGGGVEGTPPPPNLVKLARAGASVGVRQGCVDLR